MFVRCIIWHNAYCFVMLCCAVLYGQCLPHPALVLCCLPPTLSQALPLYSASAVSNSHKDVSMSCFHHSITDTLYISPFYPQSISHPLAIPPPPLYLALLITSLPAPNFFHPPLPCPTAPPSLPFPVPLLLSALPSPVPFPVPLLPFLGRLHS